jgi:hypothetical protein
MRQRAYEEWRDAAEAVGFPTAGPEMVVAVTNQRLLVCRTTFMMGRPSTIEGDVDLRRIAEVATTRHGAVTGLAFALLNGYIVEVEAMRGSRLRRFAESVREALGGRTP